jgi:FAD dependent oxidoreductase TIGR03364
MSAGYEVGIVGAGILGLAHAYQFARRGLKVAVFERHPQARGASVRNFGMIWPVGQPLGDSYGLARRSRDTWLAVLRQSGLWHHESGSLHAVYHDDEAQVLREFVAQSAGTDRQCELLEPRAVAERFPAVVQTNLRAALWSPVELAVDPREVVAGLPAWLARTHGVEFHFNTTVLGYDLPRLRTSGGERAVKRLVICTGADFRELAPAAFADSGMVLCKLQMMRSQPYGDRFRIGTHLCAGLTLGHYGGFAACPTLQTVVKRHEVELPEHRRWGVHVLVSQNAAGELTLGDTHVYGDTEACCPFDDPKLDELVLDYLKTFLNPPDLRIAARWNGTYMKTPGAAYTLARLAPDAVAVTGVGGAGMTLSFGLAERVARQLLGEGDG